MDIPGLLPLIAAYWEFDSIPGFEAHRVAAQLERLFRNLNLGAGWVAIRDDTLVGYLLAVYVFSLEHMGLTAEIDEFFVSSAARGSGIGSGLLSAAEAEFESLGCTNVSLQLSRHNDAARRFYHRQGYAERAGYELLDRMLSGPR